MTLNIDINMVGEANSTLLTNLDSIFEYRPDSVKVIHIEVANYEKAVTEWAKKMDKAKMMEMEADKFKEEVNNSSFPPFGKVHLARN